MTESKKKQPASNNEATKARKIKLDPVCGLPDMRDGDTADLIKPLPARDSAD